MAQSADTLHIRRHLVRYRVPEDRTASAVCASLDGTLTASLADRLAAVVPPGDESVWLIRRLDVKACIATSWTPSRIATAFAAAAAGALTHTLDHGADGDTVKWFPDRAAFLARFLLDRADGRDIGRWEYREFDDVAGRSSSAAIRAVSAREPKTAFEALVRLGQADLRRLLVQLAPPDAGAVLDALATATVALGADPAPLVVASLGRLIDQSALPDEPHLAALAVFIEVARKEGSPPVKTEARAREVVQLSAILRTARPEEADGLAQALTSGSWQAVGAHAMSRLSELVAWPAEARREAVRLLMHARSGAPEPTGEDQSHRLQTNLGGMFLLLPLLDEFPWEAVTAPLPDLDGIHRHRLAQYLTVIGALGAERNAAAVLDPVLRLALGIPSGVDAHAISAWTHAIDPDAIRRSTGAFIEGLLRLGKVAGSATLAPLRDGVVAIDGARGIWLGTAHAEPASIRDLVLSIDAVLGRPAAVTGSQPWIEACLESERPQPGPIHEHLLARLDDQYRYAAVGAPFDLAPAVRDLLVLTAQALARELAWRLPSFSRSSLPYLSDNVLSFEATIDLEPAQIVVRVGDPPLHLVLSLAGLNRRRFRLAATGDREWVLTQGR